MTRAPVTVRDATPGDLVELLVLWAELRETSSRSDRSAPTPRREQVLQRLREIEADPAARIVVAVRDERVVGMTVLVAAPIAPLVYSLAVHVFYLQVRTGQRRQGVGRALLAAAVAYAEECGAENVVASVPNQLRDAHRFYARLGLSPLVVRRAASVPALRKRLAADSLHSGRRGLDHVVARRRSLRMRAQAALVAD